MISLLYWWLHAVYTTAQFNPSVHGIHYFMKNADPGRTIFFTWSLFKISTCSAIPYFLASNCGSCPTTTNYTNVTCTNVPSDATQCTLAVIPTICGGIPPELIILLDINLKGNINLPLRIIRSKSVLYCYIM